MSINRIVSPPQFFSPISHSQNWGNLAELKRLTPSAPKGQSKQETKINASILETLTVRKSGIGEDIILSNARIALRNANLAGLLADSDIDEMIMKQLIAMEASKFIYEVNVDSIAGSTKIGWRLRVDLRLGIRLFVEWTKNG